MKSGWTTVGDGSEMIPFYFNDIATHYNTRLEIVPERFVAALAAMKPQTLMAANEFERAAVTIEQVPPSEQPGLLKCKTAC